MNAFERYERTNALAFDHEDEAYQMYLEQKRDREEAEGELENVLRSVELGNGTVIEVKRIRELVRFLGINLQL